MPTTVTGLCLRMGLCCARPLKHEHLHDKNEDQENDQKDFAERRLQRTDTLFVGRKRPAGCRVDVDLGDGWNSSGLPLRWQD
jgi:hypothetical protein